MKPLLAEMRSNGRIVMLSINARIRSAKPVPGCSDDPHLAQPTPNVQPQKPVAKFVSLRAKVGELESELANVSELLGPPDKYCKTFVGGDWNRDLNVMHGAAGFIQWLKQHGALQVFAKREDL
jgi:hypothetical protein